MTHGARTREATIALPAARRLIELGLSGGLERAELERISGLDLAREIDPEARFPVSRLFELWAGLGRALRDPSLPIRFALGRPLEDFQVLGFALLTSRTGREVLERGLRYSRLHDDSGTFDVAPRGRAVAVVWRRSDPLSLGVRLSNEAIIAAVWNIVREVLDLEEPRAVSFRHEAPSDVRAHRSFFRCELSFGAAEDAIVLPQDVLDVVRDVNPGLSAFVARQAEQLLAQAPEPGIAARARQVVLRGLASGEPAAALVAQELGTSERTLRRRLDEEGTSFRDLVDAVRRERAEHLLRQKSTSITEIAFALGFSDASAFSRAFRRWHQAGPRQWREAHA